MPFVTNLCDPSGHGSDVSRGGVPRDILPIVDGTTVNTVTLQDACPYLTANERERFLTEHADPVGVGCVRAIPWLTHETAFLLSARSARTDLGRGRHSD